MLTSIVMPVYNEGDSIKLALDGVLSQVVGDVELLVVYDSPVDSTAEPAAAYARADPRVKPLLNTYGRGPANALRFGIDNAAGDAVVITMADGSDDARQINALASLVRSGFAVAAASRYSRGGRQTGGPFVKRTLSRIAGLSLYWLARVGTRDATNSFKGYARWYLDQIEIESTHGFEMGLELVAKARRWRLPIAEIPTSWEDRSAGESNFRLWAWMPRYLRWYVHAFGPRVRRAVQGGEG
ncbi:MAG: glycosyltransferase family 2 protein [Acidimicrobiia bacterium]